MMRSVYCVNYYWLLLLLLFSSSPSTAVHREGDSNYFMFIEPAASKKSAQPVNDKLTESLQAALAVSEAGTSRYTDLHDKKGTFFPPGSSGSTYRGFHISEDGATSDTVDYRLPNGFITNSLCLHYVRYYRSEIPPSEMKKLHALHEYMTKKHPGVSKNDNNNNNMEL